MSSIIESLLFVSGDPVSIARLSSILETSEEDIGKAIDMLNASYQEDARGLTLISKDGEVVLASRPDNAPFVEQLVKSEREGSLSKSALETLSIISYRGPVSRTDIETIRGVNSTQTLRNLVLRGLVERRGNPDDARGYLYSVSFAFLESIGLSQCRDLPDFESLSRDERLSAVVPVCEEEDIHMGKP